MSSTLRPTEVKLCIHMLPPHPLVEESAKKYEAYVNQMAQVREASIARYLADKAAQDEVDRASQS